MTKDTSNEQRETAVTKPERSLWVTLALWVLGIILAVIIGVALLIGLILWEIQRFNEESNVTQQDRALTRLASGIAACASGVDERMKRRGLPETAPAVPRSLAQVRGDGFQSDRRSWSERAYVCADFSIEHPQVFQLQWVRIDPEHGIARATGDFDGNGAPDHIRELPIDCSAGPDRCKVGTIMERLARH